MPDTRQRLIDGTVETIRQHGIAGTTARSIAAAAGVTQALVFYHFGSVHELVKAACLAVTRDRLPLLEQRLAGMESLGDLLALHTDEQARGILRVLAQMMAGARGNPELAETTAAALRLWVAPVRTTLERLLPDRPEAAGLAEALCAALVGLQLVDGVDPDAAATALSALTHLTANPPL
ncbi:TetR/AcrR family transcriptional regulator [Kutzneria sp. CA-103260]|uniref:TetR/AcrR family transcriptional regulator n=1 Tax=Kutzneria sp. CA-103260 TaxID=2802641 RepID=UPI001BAE4F0C|nr:TetR/AcrR family transcriptional regulator [Kutzneria sp. CA-103260]QUQ66506.1 TetR family transcriptional regulator [Kutzneria sp. CA-103260]